MFTVKPKINDPIDQKFICKNTFQKKYLKTKKASDFSEALS